MLMLSGGKDELVPPSHMRELRRIREGTAGEVEGKGEKRGKGKVRWREFPLGGHNDTCLIPDYWREIASWIKEEIESGSSESIKAQ